MMVKRLFLLQSVLMITGFCFAQKKTYSVQQAWFSYNNQTRLSNKWGLWGDFQLRTQENFFDDFSIGITRVGVMYYLKENTKLTVGYAYAHYFPADSHPDIAQPEYRPWQQVQWHNNYSRLRMVQRIRLEERFRRKIKDNDELADGYNFNYRLRYNFSFNFAFNKNHFASKTISYVLNNELMVNFGKEIVYNAFDQNRLFAGFHYHTNAHDYLQFGYMYLYQQLTSGNRYRYIHAGRLSYFHTPDLRKKEPQPKP